MSALQPALSDNPPELAKGHVLYICGGRSFHAANPGNKIAGVARCWRDLGFEVSHVCGGDVGQAAAGAGQAAASYGAQAHHAAWYRNSPLLEPLWHSLSEWRDLRHDRLMAAHLSRLAAERPPMLVWERSARLHKAGLAVARRLDVPYVLEWKDHLVDYRASLFRRRALEVEAEKEREADWIVVESGVLKAQLAQAGRDGERILVAHNAVDSATFARDEAARRRFRQGLGMAEDGLMIGYLGSYAFYHDAPRLIEAAALLGERLGEGAKLVLVGAGRDRPACEALAEAQGLAGKVVFHDPVPASAVPGVLAGLDIAVLPGSTDIICPIKVQEYMAAGLPVVAPDYACNREVLSHGSTALLFRPGDPKDLAESLASLMADGERRRGMGAAAQRSAAERFSWAATWGAALETALAGRDETS